MRRGAARPAQDAAGRLLEDVGDHISREMTIRARNRQHRRVLDRTRLIDRRPEPQRYVSLRSSLSPTRAVAAAMLAAAAACVPPHPPTTTANGPTASGAGPNSVQGAPPTRYAAGHFVYDIESIGIVLSPSDTLRHTDTGNSRTRTTGPADTSHRTDTVFSRSRLTYDTRRDSGAMRVTGRVQYWITLTSGIQRAANNGALTASTTAVTSVSGAAQAGGDSVPPGAKTSSFDVVVDTTTGAVRQPGNTPAVPGCPVGGPSAEQDQALATDRPSSLVAGATWTDTSTKFSCLAGIPLTTHTSRTYTVASSLESDPVSKASAILVSYTSTVSMDGEARRRMDLHTLHGTGTGETQQYYDRTTGALLSVHTTATLHLTYSINGRPQLFEQSADWKAKLRR